MREFSTAQGNPATQRRLANSRIYDCGGGHVEAMRSKSHIWPASTSFLARVEALFQGRSRVTRHVDSEGSGAATGRRPRARRPRSANYRQHRERQLHKAKGRCRRLIKRNRLTRMATFTLRELVTDPVEGLRRIRRVQRKLQQRGIRYLIVPEFQVRGAIHYHMAFDRFIPWDWLWAWWSPEGFADYEQGGRRSGAGFDYVKPVGPKHGARLAAMAGYLTKYLSKQVGDERFEGHHAYLRPRNLHEPEWRDVWTDSLAGLMAEAMKGCDRPPVIDYAREYEEVDVCGLSPPASA